MMRLLPMIDRAVETAISAGEHKEALAQITLQDHALLLEFIQKRDGEGAEHAMGHPHAPRRGGAGRGGTINKTKRAPWIV